MNFQELLQRMNELDQPVVEEPNEGNLFTGNLAAARAAGKDKADLDGDGDMEKVHEDDVQECGMGPMEPMKQQDNVSMNISMNGSGSGGIRDLLDILRNIEQGSDNPDMDSLNDLIGGMSKEPQGKVAVIGDDMPIDEFANEPDEMYADVSAVTPTGNDMHSKGAEAEKVNGGGNPFNVDEEALLARLSSLYESIKSR